MQDACKTIIKHDRNNCLLGDSQVVYTKSHGKLRSKYVLHSVAPTWSKYVLSLDSGPEEYEKFEPLLESTFVNILKLAHDYTKLKLSSLAFPVSSSSSGGAFDVPLELWAHTLYTQLVEFQLNSSEPENLTLRTICITSLESSTVKVLCDIFSNYFDSYSESSWAMPLSPMSRLLQQVIETKPPPKPKAVPPQQPISKAQESNQAQITILQRSSQNQQHPDVIKNQSWVYIYIYISIYLFC
jgi:O-acetyl-ADP-ribose deacetylase (regulator of RNase III)